MSIKKYGIYFSHPSRSGLYQDDETNLLAFLKIAAVQDEIKFVIACPSWASDSLKGILRHHLINPNVFEFVSPSREPLICTVNDSLQHLLNRSKSGLWPRIKAKTKEALLAAFNAFMLRLISSRSWVHFLFMGLIALAGCPFLFAGIFLLKVKRVVSRRVQRVNNWLRGKFFAWCSNLDKSIYPVIIAAETRRINRIINQRKDIELWLIPSTSWVDVSRIKKECIVQVIEEFYKYSPIQFARDSLSSIDQLRHSGKLIASAKHFLIHNKAMIEVINRFSRKDKKISLIPPALSNLKHLIDISGFADNETASKTLARNFIRVISSRNLFDYCPIHHFSNELDYFFYTSGSRKRGNLINVLKAYKLILGQVPLTTKLIINQCKSIHQDALDFIKNNGLYQHVMWFDNLSEQELAACYKLSLFVIDSSFEFDDPHTVLLQSLAFNKPVILSKTIESEMMFANTTVSSHSLFDPYDYKEIAEKIRWLLGNTESLLSMQKEAAKNFEQRTVEHFFRDFLQLLNKQEPVSKKKETVSETVECVVD
ncbi:Glycosyl transferases group 1 [Legionella birminghamensis]|uniref:Glycosyl transferases group 1 n=1 Tax=Legionella birminghamensis TaxID=28083 RepID=A0A378I6A0_9GAMM|nr:glycosyltransferase [Legionella birminghamensis]KTC68748.1 Glycosyl transferases group 1 [Legionella birminghamensis]STX30266.1 Glycosyl transferases group 1 [Legionella birminghamensis]